MKIRQTCESRSRLRGTQCNLRLVHTIQRLPKPTHTWQLTTLSAVHSSVRVNQVRRHIDLCPRTENLDGTRGHPNPLGTIRRLQLAFSISCPPSSTIYLQNAKYISEKKYCMMYWRRIRCRPLATSRNNVGIEAGQGVAPCRAHPPNLFLPVRCVPTYALYFHLR